MENYFWPGLKTNEVFVVTKYNARLEQTGFKYYKNEEQARKNLGKFDSLRRENFSPEGVYSQTFLIS